MYSKVENELNFVPKELEVVKFWQDNKVFEESVKRNKGKPEFTFYDGPPTANGIPHIGHVFTRSIKDIIPRYRTMKGYHVERKAGWDTHGLPVELEVEKLIGSTGKSDIEKFGIMPFIEKCKASVWKYEKEWRNMSNRVGYWADFDNPYVTYTDNYIESVWWAIKELDKKGLLYKGHKIIPYCPRCGTGLSSHEVAMGYKDIKDTSVFVRFRLVENPDTYFLAWTTTPWTLFSNVALCVSPEIYYVTIKSGNDKYILAENLVSSLFTEYEVVSRFKGKTLEKTKYEPLFDGVKAKYADKAWFVVCDKYVTTSDGSGIVHIAPAFGEDDARVGKKYNLPFVQLVDERGRLTKECGSFASKDAILSNPAIIDKLETNGSLFSKLSIEHTYPHCWRCDTPLIYYARESWFIKMTAVRDNLVANNRTINWFPDHFKEGRMGKFLEEVVDWGISRDRYWGTPLPVWICKDCGHYHVVGSIKELFELTGQTIKELHKPYVDEVTIKCTKCGGVMTRTNEVMDCWLDSGAMPFAQHHYPFENKEKFEKQFPADFISEGTDQSRGWFYSLQAISTALFGKSPYKTCIALGLINDKDGIKMSKHKGNVVNPWDILNNQGADALRWYFFVGSAPWISAKFDSADVDEIKRKFMGTIWNTYSFYVLYANIDKFNPSKYELKNCQLSMLDKWILSELNSLIKFVDEGLENYNITETARQMEIFVDNLSNWYIRRGRKRYWGENMTDDKVAAYMTLYTVISEFIKLLAPYQPFITETIYQNLVRNSYKNAPISVHLNDYPKTDEKFIDKELQAQMKTVYETVVAGRAGRSTCNIKNRQPLSKMFVSFADINVICTEEMASIIKDELNIDEIVFTSTLDGMAKYIIKPQLKTLGPKYGSLINGIREYLSNCNGKILLNEINGSGYAKTTINGKEVEFTLDDLLITKANMEGYSTVTENGVTVVLDTTLNDDLIARGFEREFISKVQNMRKSANCQIEDRINVFVSGHKDTVNYILSKFKNAKKDVLASIIVAGEGGVYKEDFDMDEKNIVIGIEKA
ncbi:MAG: isoleucine--tRNA ligase [Clostridia bacterium]|jgi:isoleucyl-tRNA synthetase